MNKLILDAQDELSTVSSFVEMIFMATSRTPSIEEKAINALAHEIAGRIEQIDLMLNKAKIGIAANRHSKGGAA